MTQSMITPRRQERRSHRERSEQSFHRMLDAATALILEVGTAQTTLKEIGERAGYSRGLANARFGSKDALFAALAERCRATWIAELQDVSEGRHGMGALIARLDATASFARSRPDLARVMYILWFESIGAQTEITASLARFHEQARADAAALALRAGLFAGHEAEQEADAFAVRFCGTLFGIAYQWLVNPAAIDVEDAVEGARRALLAGSL